MRQQPCDGHGGFVDALILPPHFSSLAQRDCPRRNSDPPPSGDQAIGGTPRSCKNAMSPLVKGA